MQHDVEHSAGGVLIRALEGAHHVCLIQVETRGGNPSWRLPKGWIEAEETPEETALRETLEETGCHGSLISPLSPVEYWYTRRDPDRNTIRVQKLVAFFLMKYEKGDIKDHDHEVDDARWFSFDDALSTISYDAEKHVLQEALHSWAAHLYRENLDM